MSRNKSRLEFAFRVSLLRRFSPLRGTPVTIEVISFIIGGILIGTAVVGGGFEVKEIKMPRVGAGVRIASLVVGSGFLLLAMGIWGANNPGLLGEQVPVNSLAPAVNPAAPPQQPEAQAPAPEVRQPQPPIQPEPAWAEEVAAPAFTGFSGNFGVVWTVEGTSHSGAASFNGPSGFIRVAFVNPFTQMEQWVDQDLVLQESEGVFWYVGVNPRDASTQQLLGEMEYTQDNFRVAADGHGGWTIDAVCAQGFCFPVFIQ